mgnify:CR=1 FL=1
MNAGPLFGTNKQPLSFSKAGNEFLCPLDALKSVHEATEDELDECVEEAVVGRYAGNVDVVD